MANYTEIVQIIIPNLTITHDYVSTITLHNPTNLTATIDRPKISFTAFDTRQKIFFTLTKDILLPAMIVEVVTENLSVDIMSPNRFLYLSQLLTCPSTICKEETRMTTTPGGVPVVVDGQVVTMEMVEVARFVGWYDDALNQADTTGYGQVSTRAVGGTGYSYKIGKYEVTGSQYAAFLNAIAKTDAAYGLYNTNMGTDPSGSGYAQISRSGTSGSYAYAVMNNTGQRPITYVSWFDCARFCNWMSNGQPRGDQTTRTTENGAYFVNGATSGSAIPSNSINPNAGAGAGATYRVPTENEWYKAAYYKGGNSNTAGYWTYPTQSNNQPGTTIGVNPNQVNYGNAFRRAIDVGSFSGSASAYGTFDQGGNVNEWNDLDNTVGPTRGYRGGNWADGSAGSSSARNVADPSTESSSLGFRIVRYNS